MSAATTLRSARITSSHVGEQVARAITALGTLRPEAVDAATGVYLTLYDWHPLRRRDRRLRRQWLDLLADALHYTYEEDAL